jgi:hypothetical protein
MAFKAINNIVRLNRLVLILLVYSVYPRITEHDPLLLSITQQALTIKKAIAKRQVNDALCYGSTLAHAALVPIRLSWRT